jgi:hypothetical protein
MSQSRKLVPAGITRDEADRLEARISQLLSQVAEKELLLQTVTAELAAFEHRFQRVLGPRYAELAELEAQLAELFALHKRSNEPAQERARAARAHANSFDGAAMGDPEEPRHDERTEPLEGEAFNPSDELKALFRRVAKQVHPDGATDEKERAVRNEIMARANEAYRRQDRQALEDILDEWAKSPETVRGDDPAAKLERLSRQVSQLELRLRKLDNEMKDLQSSNQYLLKLEVQAGEQFGQDRLGALAAQLDAKIASAKAELAAVDRD